LPIDRRYHAHRRRVRGGRPLGASTTSVETSASRDADVSLPKTQASLDLNLVWQPPRALNLQLDAGANAGITRATAAIELCVGITRHF